MGCELPILYLDYTYSAFQGCIHYYLAKSEMLLPVARVLLAQNRIIACDFDSIQTAYSLAITLVGTNVGISILFHSFD